MASAVLWSCSAKNSSDRVRFSALRASKAATLAFALEELMENWSRQQPPQVKKAVGVAPIKKPPGVGMCENYRPTRVESRWKKADHSTPDHVQTDLDHSLIWLVLSRGDDFQLHTNKHICSHQLHSRGAICVCNVTCLECQRSASHAKKKRR